MKSVSSCDAETRAGSRHSPAQEKGQILFNAQAPGGWGLALSSGSTQPAAWGTDYRVSPALPE